jgi:hypothetical protein
MLTLIISVGIYAIECVGSNCYSISQGSFEAMLGLGIAELIYEIPNLIRIYRKRED